MRFHQSFQLLPGVRINVGARGVSASSGVLGATINVGAQGVRATAGIPGSGLSYSTFSLAAASNRVRWSPRSTSRTKLSPAQAALPKLSPMRR